MRLGGAHKAIFGATVSAFTPPATYDPSWLTDGQLNYPGYQTGGSLSATVSFTAKDIDLVVVGNHNIKQAATIAISGGVSGNIPTAALPASGIPVNWRLLLATPVNAASFSIAVTGNTDPVTIGELWAGLTSEFPGFLHGTRLTPQTPFLWEGEYESLAPLDPGISAQRRRSGTIVLTDAQFVELDAVYLSQRLGHRPLVYLDDDATNDAWLCQMHYEEEHNEGWHFVQLQITEIPRTSW